MSYYPSVLSKSMDYESREKLKAEGWELFGKAQSAHAKRNVLMHFIITAHYWRAREAIEARKSPKKALKMIYALYYTPGYEMDIDHYTPHWLFSQRNQRFMTKEIYDACKEWYQPKRSNYLPEGMTLYQLPGDVS